MLIFDRPTTQATARLLDESESQFQKSNESAHSVDTIVPSQMSILTSQRDSSTSIHSQATIRSRRLDFENRLFTSKVYMRNCKNLMIKELSKARTTFRRKDTATGADRDVVDWEAIRGQLEADSLLATNSEKSIGGSEAVKDNQNNYNVNLADSPYYLKSEPILPEERKSSMEQRVDIITESGFGERLSWHSPPRSVLKPGSVSELTEMGHRKRKSYTRSPDPELGPFEQSLYK